MATGLLVLGVGPATRLLTHLVGLDKVYTATIRLGVSTVSDDREGNVLDIAPPADVLALASQPERIAAAVATLTGKIEQAPSAVSAIKVDGRRAYERVRAGEQLELNKRPVTIQSFEIEEPRCASVVGISGGEMPVDVIDIDATVACSSGTYVRALARDLGAALGVGGHLIALRRTQVGPLRVADAVTNERIAAGEAGPSDLIAPAEIAAQLFPVARLTRQQAVDLGHGKRVDLDPGQGPDAELAAAIAPDERLIGLVQIKHGRTRVVTNFPQPTPAPDDAEGRLT